MEYAIEHHGIKGQKWGVRRFQNADGTLTIAGKKRYSTGETDSKSSSIISKDTAIKVAAGAVVIAGVAASAVYVKNHPEVVTKVTDGLKTIGDQTLTSIDVLKEHVSVNTPPPVKATFNKVVDVGKNYLEQAAKNAVDGAKEGALNAPKKVAKAAVEGAAIIAANKMLNAIVGEQNAADYKQAYNAYNKKNKIGAMPNRDKNEDDEDD